MGPEREPPQGTRQHQRRVVSCTVLILTRRFPGLVDTAPRIQRTVGLAGSNGADGGVGATGAQPKGLPGATAPMGPTGAHRETPRRSTTPVAQGLKI